MADGKFLIGKPAGGVTTVTMTDGASNTNLVLPESGTVATLSNIQGFKNLIINGRKQVNQSGLTSTGNSYNQDRWYKAGNNWFQGIEGDNNLVSGKTYTLSFVGAATASYYVGTATSSTINAQTFISIANGGTFTLTISAGQNLWIKFASDATGSTFNFVQLEEGSVSTPFENRPYGLELSLCQRYYWSVSGTVYGQFNNHGTPQLCSLVLKHPVTMRIVPTVTSLSGAILPSVDSTTTYLVVSNGSIAQTSSGTFSAEL